MSPCEATPQVLCPILGPSVQEELFGARASPVKGSETGEGCGTRALHGVAEGAGGVQGAVKEARGAPYGSLQLQEGAARWASGSAPRQQRQDESTES